jgi:hypothetical protein
MWLGLKVVFVPKAFGILSQYQNLVHKKNNLYWVGFKIGVRPDSYRDALPRYSFKKTLPHKKTQPLLGWV